MWNRMWNCTSKWIRFKYVIEHQFYYVNECGAKYEIVNQSKIRFIYLMKCQIYYINVETNV